VRLARIVIVVSLVACITPVASSADPESVIREALAAAESIPNQALALIDLAWPDEPGDPSVAARAKEMIIDFGEAGIPHLRAAIPTARPEHQGEIVRAFIAAKRQMTSRIPADYYPGLEEAVWFGSEDARISALPELAAGRYSLAVLTIEDAAYETPRLLPLCIETLGKIGDDRARFFLEKHLQEGKGEVQDLAAQALASIGARAMLPLKAALRSDRRSVREAAARAFVPVAEPDDASALSEYAASHPRDDPETLRRVHEATVMLEKIREAKEAAEASSASPENP
jgi:hypothetical protein